MKKSTKIFHIIGFFVFLHLEVFSQAGPPPPPGDPSSSGGPVGGSAPIGAGVGLLLTMTATYGAAKLYRFWRDDLEA